MGRKEAFLLAEEWALLEKILALLPRNIRSLPLLPSKSMAISTEFPSEVTKEASSNQAFEAIKWVVLPVFFASMILN